MRWPTLALALLLLLPLAARAQPDPLYAARTITTGTDLRERPAGLARCLASVLVKVSGDPSLADDPRAEALASEAGTLVEDFDYQDRMGQLPLHDEQGSRDRPYWLACRFSPAAIDAALRQLGRVPWPAPRPWLLARISVTERSGDTYPLLADVPKGDGPRAALFTAADGAGLRVSLPREDGAVPPGLLTLDGTLGWSDAEFGWVAEWRLDWQADSFRWRIAGVSYDAAMRSGLRGAAAVLSGNAAKLASATR